MKKKILALAIGSVLSGGVQAALTDILITEYVEGSGYNKALELTNLGDTDYEFPADIGISKQGDGKTDGWGTLFDLEGTIITAGNTFVLVEKNSRSQVIRDAITANDGTPVLATASFANGNDALALADITDPKNPVLIDVVGVVDNSQNWGKDLILRRRLLEGDNTPVQKVAYDPKEWLELNKDDYTGLAIADLAPAPIQFTCTEDNIRTTIEDIQGDSWKSPLIAKGKYESADSIYVEAIVTAVTSLPRVGLYLQQTGSDPLSSEGIFVETNVATTDLVGKTVCLSSKVYEDYGFTKLKTSNFEIIDAGTAVPEAVEIKILDTDVNDKGDFDFQKTLERYEGMLVRLPADMDANVDGEQTMRVSRTFSRDYGARRDNISLAYKRPNMQPNQEHVAGSDEAKAQIAENKNYRMILESNEKVENDGSIPYYPTFLDNPNVNYIRVNDSVVGIEGILSHSYGNFSLTVTNEATVDTFKHATPRTDKPSLNTGTVNGEFSITIATQNVLNLFNSPVGGDENPTGQNRGALSQAEYDRQLAKITTAILALNTDIVGLMEIENNGFGDNGALKALVESINSDIADTKNHYVFVGIDSNIDGKLNNEDTIGTDAITKGLLYRPSKVTLDSSGIIQMPQQHAPAVVNEDGKEIESGDNYQRDTLAATFIVNQTGKKLNIAVNHFKSKGSTCWEDVESGEKVDNDLQGSCEKFRVAAAYQLGTEFGKFKGDSVILGDLNAYGSEDPLLVLTQNLTKKVLTTARNTYIGGDKDTLGTPQFNPEGTPFTVDKSFNYINIVDKMDKVKGKTGWSYSYNDEIGSLDHMLVNASLEARVIDAGDWHINSTESTYFQYNKEGKYGPVISDAAYDAYNGGEATPFRSSDHDPAFMSLRYKYGEADVGQAVVLPILNNTINLTYAVPNGIETKKGNILTVKITSKTTTKTKTLRFVLENNDQSIIPMKIKDIQTGYFTIKMQLLRVDGDKEVAVAGSDVNMDITVVQSVLSTEENTAGSFSIFSIISLLGLGFLRRKTK